MAGTEAMAPTANEQLLRAAEHGWLDEVKKALAKQSRPREQKPWAEANSSSWGSSAWPHRCSAAPSGEECSD